MLLKPARSSCSQLRRPGRLLETASVRGAVATLRPVLPPTRCVLQTTRSHEGRRSQKGCRSSALLLAPSRAGFQLAGGRWQDLPGGWEAALWAALRGLASAERFCLQPAAWSQQRAVGLPQLGFLTDGQFNEPMYRGSFNMAIIPINLFAAGLE